MTKDYMSSSVEIEYEKTDSGWLPNNWFCYEYLPNSNTVSQSFHYKVSQRIIDPESSDADFDVSLVPGMLIVDNRNPPSQFFRVGKDGYELIPVPDSYVLPFNEARDLHQNNVDEPVVRIPRPLMSEAHQAIPIAENQNSTTTNNDPPSPKGDRILSLEQQFWNVRVVLGAMVGALAGVLLFASLGAVIGMLVGGVMAALGWRSVDILAGGSVGALLGSVHLVGNGGGFAGSLLGGLVGFLIADIGRSSKRPKFPLS